MKKDDSIRTKVTRQILNISLISMLLVFTVAMIGTVFLRRSTIDISEALGSSAAEDSREAITELTKQMLQELARSKTELSDEKIMEYERFVNIMANHSTLMLRPQGVNTGQDIPFPDPANEGIVVAQLQLAPGIVLDDVRQEIRTLSNNQSLFTEIVKNNESLSSVYIATESGFIISVDDDSHRKTNLFDARRRGWYVAAKGSDNLIWSDVYDDIDGRGLIITCAKPFYDRDGKIAGVVAIDFPLSKLNEIILDTKVGETGHSFVLNDSGRMVISTNIQKDDRGNIVRENLLKSDNERLRDIAVKMTSGHSGFEEITINGKDYFIAYEPFGTLSWSIATFTGVEEALKMAHESEQDIIDLRNEALYKIDSGVLAICLVLILLLLAIVTAAVYIAKKIAEHLTEPIIELTKGARIIGGGDFNHKLEVKTGDEIETLSDTFNIMINNITEITKEKERIGAELDVATKIQASMLPCIFPPFPERTEFEIYGSMRPAREVGGDFYDFFFVDDNHLCLVIADVSGKGVPAALFMVITKTLIKNNAQAGRSPSEVFETVNNQLCENNDADMFVTAFMGILEISTGKFTFVNAGHNPPLIMSAGGDFDWMQTKRGFVLAGFEGTTYKQSEVTFSKGDALFMYTDGVTEAMNENEDLFTEAKLLSDLNKYKDNSLEELLGAVKNEIDLFSGNMEQADDITMLLIKIM